jgi:hypothetical protein
MHTCSQNLSRLSPLRMHCCTYACSPLRVTPGVPAAAARLTLAALRHPRCPLAAQLQVEQQQQHLPLQSSPANRST